MFTRIRCSASGSDGGGHFGRYSQACKDTWKDGNGWDDMERASPELIELNGHPHGLTRAWPFELPHHAWMLDPLTWFGGPPRRCAGARAGIRFLATAASQISLASAAQARNYPPSLTFVTRVFGIPPETPTEKIFLAPLRAVLPSLSCTRWWERTSRSPIAGTSSVNAPVSAVH
ncbi:hypothetical protein HYQ46_005403 [Verticillium longisporum]|nr:hypothetical protein HYQ46_005403 [Verticillium longisporum]